MMQPLPTMTWRAAVILWVAAVVAAIPFAALLPALPGWRAEAPTFTWILTGLGMVFAVAALVGWAMGSRVGLGAPVTEAWLGGGRPDGRMLVRSAGLGVALALAAVVSVLIMFEGGGADSVTDVEILPLWGGVALALYGGVGEELVFRFGLMSLVAWVIGQLRRLVHSWEAAPNEAMAAWGGIVISSILFGLAHFGMGPGSLLIQASFRVAAGLLFGWLYWKRGIEAAMAAHIAYNLVGFYVVVVVV